MGVLFGHFTAVMTEDALTRHGGSGGHGQVGGRRVAQIMDASIGDPRPGAEGVPPFVDVGDVLFTGG